MLCLIYHRNFDGMLALYDSNRYIKRLNNIEIEKNALFWAVKSQFSERGGLASGYPLHRDLNRRPSYPCHPCFKLLVTTLAKHAAFKENEQRMVGS